MRTHPIILSALVVTLTACTALSPAKPQVSDVQGEPTFGIDAQGNPDAGYSVSFTITNNGKAGEVWIHPKLSTSEGEYTREQTLHFNAGETKHLTYQFLEPSIQATNVYPSVNTLP